MLNEFMDLNRRDFLVLPAAALPGPALFAAEPAVPWQRKIRRLGQTNMTEHDPAVLDVEQWADYWASLKVDAVLVSVTGILAFYQTKVPFHRKGKFLGNRDFFGECCAAAKKRGMHVIARMSPDLNWEDAVQAHPEWFQRDAQGNAVHHTEDPRLFRTCMFTTYMTDYMPAIMREINSLYDVDGLFTNAWPPLGAHAGLPLRTVPETAASRERIAYWDKFNERTIYLWKLYDSIAKEKKPANFYFANLGGGIRSTADLVKLGEICEWFQCDNQGRGGDDTPIWGCALQGRVCNAVQKGKMATNVTAAWSTGTPRWRNVYKSPAGRADVVRRDARLRHGAVPPHHRRRERDGRGPPLAGAGAQVFQLDGASTTPHFVNKRSIANMGVVMGQRTHLFYKPPRGALMREYMDGMYYALLEGRFLFDFVHEDKLAPEDLAKYSALLLPNTALLSDQQCRQLRAYVDAGGSLLATFETSLYNERNERRADFGLADVFGIRKAGEVVGTIGQRLPGAHREAARDSRRLCGHELDSRGGEPHARRAGGWPGPDRGARLRGVSAGAVVSAAAAHQRTGGRGAAEGQEPAGLLPRRHRAHHVAIGPYRSGAAAAELHPLGGRRESAGDDRRRGRDRDVRVGDAGGLRRARAQLHEPRHAPRMDPEFLSDRRAEGAGCRCRRAGA